MNKILPIILVVVLSGCAGTPKEVFLPSGEKGYTLRCVEKATDCMGIIGDTCKEKGYKIVREKQLRPDPLGAPGPTTFLYTCNE